METIITIVLIFIAYTLWKIYRQRESELTDAREKILEADYEKKKRERFKNYPHLYGKLEGNWLDVFAHHAESGTPILKLSFMLMLGESTKFDLSDGSIKWDNLWACTEELLEHLDKHHEGTRLEHEIAVATYWQIAAEEVSKLTEDNPEVEGSKIEVKPYTNLEKIVNLFPQKNNHPEQEITFYSGEGSFPRESNGSELIRKRMSEQGL